jgi:PKD repeat protein
MAYDTGISSAVAQYVYTQSNGAVTEPIGGSYLQAYCEYLGATTLIGNSWLITLCDHFGITEPLNGSWTIALANYYGITYPTGGTWWQALTEAPAGYKPTADFTSDVTEIAATGTVNFTDTSTVDPLGPPITDWLWTFEGGTPATSTLQNPSIQYNTEGNYQVALQVTNADGDDTKTVPNYMTVTEAPVDYTISEFATDIMYNTVSNPFDTTEFSVSLLTNKLQTT